MLIVCNIYSYDFNTYVYVYDSYQSTYPKKMILVGEVKVKVKAPEIKRKESPVKEYDIQKDLVTVKVINQKGLKIGQKLYVVFKDPYHEKYKNALIIGEIIVQSILNHPLYGLVLTGVGNLLRVKEGYYVVRSLESENIEKAYLIKRKGDAYFSQGQWQKAIGEYLRSLNQDKDLVEAHVALANVYFEIYKLEKEEKFSETPANFLSLQNALLEYRKAFKLKNNFRFQKDYFEYIFNYFNSLLDFFYSFRFTHNPENLKIFKEMETISTECSKISDHIECKMIEAIANYYLMSFYSSQDSKVKREMYDIYKIKAGNLFKFIEEERKKELGENLVQLSIENKLKNSYIEILHYEFAFINFYYLLFNQMNQLEKVEEKKKLQSILYKHIGSYFLLSKDKPQYHNMNLIINKIRNQVM